MNLDALARALEETKDPDVWRVLHGALLAEKAVKEHAIRRGWEALTPEHVPEILRDVPGAILAPSVAGMIELLRITLRHPNVRLEADGIVIDSDAPLKRRLPGNVKRLRSAKPLSYSSERTGITSEEVRGAIRESLGAAGDTGRADPKRTAARLLRRIGDAISVPAVEVSPSEVWRAFRLSPESPSGRTFERWRSGANKEGVREKKKPGRKRKPDTREG